MRTVDRVLLAIGLLVWLPAVPFAVALLVGAAAGCTLSENDVHPCVIAGINLGLPLTLMALMGWAVVALLPFMALTGVAGVLWGCIRLVLAWRRARRAAGPPVP